MSENKVTQLHGRIIEAVPSLRSFPCGRFSNANFDDQQIILGLTIAELGDKRLLNLTEAREREIIRERRQQLTFDQRERNAAQYERDFYTTAVDLASGLCPGTLPDVDTLVCKKSAFFSLSSSLSGVVEARKGISTRKTISPRVQSPLRRKPETAIPSSPSPKPKPKPQTNKRERPRRKIVASADDIFGAPSGVREHARRQEEFVTKTSNSNSEEIAALQAKVRSLEMENMKLRSMHEQVQENVQKAFPSNSGSEFFDFYIRRLTFLEEQLVLTSSVNHLLTKNNASLVTTCIENELDLPVLSQVPDEESVFEDPPVLNPTACATLADALVRVLGTLPVLESVSRQTVLDAQQALLSVLPSLVKILPTHTPITDLSFTGIDEFQSIDLDGFLRKDVKPVLKKVKGGSVRSEIMALIKFLVSLLGRMGEAFAIVSNNTVEDIHRRPASREKSSASEARDSRSAVPQPCIIAFRDFMDIFYTFQANPDSSGLKLLLDHLKENSSEMMDLADYLEVQM
ncbi:hypothetical protein PCE1_004367 [Barthelona sp. PCE]